MNSDSIPSPSLPNLLRELRDESTTLLQQEVALAKAEMKENVANLMNHSVQIAIGSFVSYAGVIVLLIGIGWLISSLLVRAGLDPQLAQWLAPTAVGIIVALVGWGMVARAKHSIAMEDVAPKRTIETLQRDKQWAETKLQQSR